MINVYKTSKMKKHLDTEWFNPNFKNHQLHPKHMLVCGGTGMGKSNFVVNLITQFFNTFQKIIIVTTLQQEPLYNLLKDQLKEQCEIISIKDLISVTEQDQTPKLIIFDDFIHLKEKETKIINEYATISRKKMCMCLYLTQSFFATSKTIRQNVRYVVLLNLSDKRNIDAISGSIAAELEPRILKSIIRNATQHSLNVLIIDTQEKDINKKFRRNFNDFYQFQEDDEGNYYPVNSYEGSGIIN